MKPIRVAHLGAAHDHSGLTLETVRKFPEVFTVVSVTEKDPAVRARVENQSAYQGLPWITEEELFARDDIDAVLCEGDELCALDDAYRCIQKGWHVHMDKPAGTDIRKLEEMLALAESKHLTFQTGYMYRYNPAMKYLRDRVRSGKLGEILSIEASMGVCHPDEKRAWLGRFQGGMMFFLGCHLIDMVYSLWGTPERIVTFNQQAGDEINAQDNCLAVFEYKHGTAQIRVNAAEVNGYNRRHLVVCGSEGTVEIRPLECPTHVYETLKCEAEGKTWRDAKHEVFPGYLPGRYDEMMLEFAQCIRGEKENPYPYAYEAQLQRLVLAASGYHLDFSEKE